MLSWDLGLFLDVQEMALAKTAAHQLCLVCLDQKDLAMVTYLICSGHIQDNNNNCDFLFENSPAIVGMPFMVVICWIIKGLVRFAFIAAVEGAMTVRTVTEDMKYRKLPQPPVQAAPSQPAQQQRPPSPHSELRQQAKPPLPRPRPQRKPLHRAKERP